jgi:hypothetical protein
MFKETEISGSFASETATSGCVPFDDYSEKDGDSVAFRPVIQLPIRTFGDNEAGSLSYLPYKARI